MDMNLNGASSSRQSEIYIATEEWEIDLSKLRIKNVIANGTYGTVYKGVYDGQDVAVKVMDWGADGDARTAVNRASFEQEVAIWHKLDHPNVTKFIGASMGTSNLQIPSTNSDGQGSLPANACCVVVEYLQGTLKNYLMKYRHRKLPYKTVIQLALDLARGLSYLHSKQIAHRDVKTENMLLDTKRTVKIADFGVARVEAKNASEMTVLTGTLGYMAPEHLPPEIPRCCPSALTNIMQKCWSGYPENRPSMAEVVRLLEALDTRKGGGMIPEGQKSGCFCFGVPRGP
ncbi:serine/threonine-protein kinase STY13-like isoform X2 [Papaver somniferum]|uniref:serine/threonine-protein kinase STY13-like isoform X2 n=1 Tax=Papaver somniferum TaxID=3469 RepID=UPI000E7002EA|nr:serine/threonine-protein kinase STY13-like isoform X2 [Papaver somniferum]